MTAVDIKAFKRTSIEFHFKFKFLIMFFGLASLETPQPVLLFTMLSTRESALAIVQIFAQTFACPQSWDQVKEICKGRRKQGGREGACPLQFLKGQLTLNQPKGKIMPFTLLLGPPRFSDLPTFLFAHSWVHFLSLGTQSTWFGRKG